MFHHLSFLAVSLAMMGLGLGGLVVTLAPGTFRLDNVAPATMTSGLGAPSALLLAAAVGAFAGFVLADRRRSTRAWRPWPSSRSSWARARPT